MKKVLIMTVILTSMVMVSCNVTRTIVTKSEVRQDGETKTIIESRTVESYDASKKLTIY